MLATCLVAAATVVGVVIAGRGLRTWRAQLEGSAHFELARGLLLEVYRLRDAVESVRHPYLESSEATESDTGIPWEIAAYEARWQRVVEAETRLQVFIYEARILWGESITGIADELRGTVTSLYAVLMQYAEDVRNETHDLSAKEREVLYSRGIDDGFRNRMTTAVEQFERFVRPHLPGQ
jgi:hypothetical protein